MPGSVTPLELTGVQIPYHFRCPISLELMRDPVTVSTGQTYDRPSIESWVATGNTTCPVTRAPLTDFSLIPNHTLRRLIQEWCVAHRSHGVERIPTPKQPADPSLVRLLISQSSAAAAGDLAGRITALRRIRCLARESDKNRSVIATAETRSALISIAFEELDLSSDLSTEAIAVLSMFSLTESESLQITMVPERLEYLASVMVSHSSIECRINAAAVIEAAAAASRSSEIRSAVGSVVGVMEAFVRLAAQKESARGAKIGIRGIFSLCLAKENRQKAIEAGAATAIMRRLGELKEGELERGLATVELMCRAEGGREAVVSGAGGGREAVAVLVRAMAAGGRGAAEHAAGAMVAVVGPSEVLQREAVAAGVVMQLLVMVQSGCSDRAKRKAQVLLKMVRSSWPADSDVANSDDYYFHPY